jgi:hypothetical protein
MNELIINVIYVKGTVKLLLPFAQTFLDHTNVRYRLISNGCSEEEELILREFARSDERLLYFSMNSSSIQSHHSILIELLFKDDSNYFAFIDSDIIVESDFVLSMLNKLEEADAVFSGLPLWHEPTDHLIPRKHKVMGGLHTKTHNNVQLGVTYCAFYDRKKIQKFIKKSGLDFRIYLWKDVPSIYQKKLIDLDLKKDFYDTSKVLNIFWQESGARLSFDNGVGLVHIGGISGDSKNHKLSIKVKQYVSTYLPFRVSGLMRTVYKRESLFNSQESVDLLYLAHRRRTTQNYFYKIMTSPNYPYKDKSLDFKRLRKQYLEQLDFYGRKAFDLKTNFWLKRT